MMDRNNHSALGRCWCGGRVKEEFGYCGRWGLWCQYGHPHQTRATSPTSRIVYPKLPLGSSVADPPLFPTTVVH